MARSKKAKRDDRVVAYTRLKPRDHAQIVKIAEQRGHPHTIASVIAELVSQSLPPEVSPKGTARP